jgi:acetyl-CoA C-acetyltransferase
VFNKVRKSIKGLARPVDIIGVGLSDFGFATDAPCLNLTTRELWAQAVSEAVKDAGITPSQIEALFVGNMRGDYNEGQYHLGYVLGMWSGLSLGNDAWKSSVRIEGACASSSHAIRQAVFAVASGAYDVVIAGGVEQSNTKWDWKNPGLAMNMSNPEVLNGIYAHLDQGWELPNMNMLDHILNQWIFAYAKRYGISKNDLYDIFDARIFSNWQNGVYTQGLYWNKPIASVLEEAGVNDIHEFLRSPVHNPVIIWPLRRWDYIRRCDGAAVVIICAADVSKYAKSKPIRYLGTGNALQTSAISRDMYTQPFIVEAGKEAYEMAGISPDDVDVVEMYDFGPAEYLIPLEDLGFLERGQSSEMLLKGETLYSGTRPVNPSSGGVTCGAAIGAVGAACIVHLTKQLRGEAGANQVNPLPKAGMVYDCGAARNAVIHLMGR